MSEFKTNTLKVNDVDIHFIDEGQGDPIVFLHGVPTSSHVWSGILPYFLDHGRCIVPDLVGFGESGKPDIEYSITDHIEYISAFLDELKLDKITFVMQAWGSIVGFDYARRHPRKMKGLAFFESYVRPITDWTMMSLPMQDLAAMIAQTDGQEMLEKTDYFVEKIMPRALLKDMDKSDVLIYKNALNKTKRHQPLVQYLKELPTGSEPEYVTQTITQYSTWLTKSKLPKLLIYGVPGYNTTMSTIVWAKDHLPNLTMTDIGPMLHFPQVSNPQEVGQAILKWMRTFDES